MNSRTFTYLFPGIGIFFALLSIYLSLRPVSIRELYRGDSPYGIISMGFISVFAFSFRECLLKNSRINMSSLTTFAIYLLNKDGRAIAGNTIQQQLSEARNFVSCHTVAENLFAHQDFSPA